MDTNSTVIAQSWNTFALLTVPALISSITSFTFCLSYIIFHDSMKEKVSYRLLFYIFMSNTLTSIGGLPGFPVSGSPLCWFQGLVTNIFSISSILWTVDLAFLLYTIIAWKNPMNVNIYHHVIVWGISVLSTLLPLINSTYGAQDKLGWCWVVNKPDGTSPYWASLFWFWMSYYFWVWGGFIIMMILFIIILFKMKNLKGITLNNFKRTLITLSGYPIIIALTWIPSTIFDFIQYTDENSPLLTYNFNVASTITANLLGCFSAILFWITDNKVKEKWIGLYKVGFKFNEWKELEKGKKRGEEGGGGRESGVKGKDGKKIMSTIQETSERNSSAAINVVFIGPDNVKDIVKKDYYLS